METAALLEQIAAGARLPPGADWELYFLREETRSHHWAGGQSDLQELASTQGLSVRVLEKGGQGIVTTSRVDPKCAGDLFTSALQMARFSSRDEHRSLADRPGEEPPRLPMDSSLFSQPAQETIDQLRALEENALKKDERLKKVVRFQRSETRIKRTIMNSHGLNLSDESTQGVFLAELLAEEPRTPSEVGWGYQANRFLSELNPGAVVDDVALHALKSLGGKPIPSGVYSTLLLPRVGAQLIQLVASALSAVAVQFGRSFLKAKKGQPVASPLVHLVDDPFYREGIASESFDDEGVPHRRMDVVEGGVLRDYFYDIKSARKEGIQSNGHGKKSNLQSPATPEATSLCVKAGPASPEELLASEENIFCVRDVMGLHMADPVTGEFSLGASGYLYKKGSFVQPVRGVTMAGRIGEVLKNVQAVGNDLTWFGNFGAPSLLVKSVTVAGV